ncbi:hypothetical protein NQ317_001519 [Molorchus minor]|uniref:FH2 domain-containing protein n=1 Tax=Molorchus minor TaxID=1323400 RepID=A0ABQ9J459_9CUCU|nr:hypothetical protein NQ317_001519 [Molorchus minor]
MSQQDISKDVCGCYWDTLEKVEDHYNTNIRLERNLIYQSYWNLEKSNYNVIVGMSPLRDFLPTVKLIDNVSHKYVTFILCDWRDFIEHVSNFNERDSTSSHYDGNNFKIKYVDDPGTDIVIVETVENCISLSGKCIEELNAIRSLIDYRLHFLQDLNFADFYENWRDNQSKFAIQWLTWLEHKREINILHAAKGKESVVHGVKVDGFCPDTKETFEFHGCYFHGCEKCFQHGRDVPLQDNETMYSRWESTVAKSERRSVCVLPTVNVVIAAYVTTQARLKLYCYLERLSNRVLYYDTDSVIYVSKKGSYEPETGDFIGDMTNELEVYGKDSYISEFVSGGPKNYAYKVFSTRDNKEKVVCKVKGISLSYEASQLINFDSIKEMVVRPTEPLSILSKHIRRTAEHEVVTVTQTKLYKPNSLKRKFLEDHNSTPYGYKRNKQIPGASTTDTAEPAITTTASSRPPSNHEPMKKNPQEAQQEPPRPGPPTTNTASATSQQQRNVRRGESAVTSAETSAPSLRNLPLAPVHPPFGGFSDLMKQFEILNQNINITETIKAITELNTLLAPVSDPMEKIATLQYFQTQKRQSKQQKGRRCSSTYQKEHTAHPLPPVSINDNIEDIAVLLANQLEIRAVYNTPRNTLTPDDLAELLQSNQTLLIGDLNARHTAWRNRGNNRNGRVLLEYALEENLAILTPDSPTHYPRNNTTPSYIDLIVNKNVTQDIAPISRQELNSDHNLIQFQIGDVPLNQTRRKIYNYKQANWNLYRAIINNRLKLPTNIETPQDIDAAIQDLTGLITLARNQSTESVWQRPREIKRRWQRHRRAVDRDRLTKIEATIRTQIKAHKDATWTNKIESLSTDNNSLWKFTKLLRRPFAPIPTLRTGNNNVMGDEGKSNVMADNLQRVTETRPDNTREQENITVAVNSLQERYNIAPRKLAKLFTSPQELKDIIKYLPNNKAPGPDNIPNILIKNLPKKALYLVNSPELKKVVAIILTLGNYMNGGNMTRGQADGFGLEILSKLKDVKSKDSKITLLHYIVRLYTKKIEYPLGPNFPLPIPEPGDIKRASSVNFDDLRIDLHKLQQQLKACETKYERIIAASTPENLQPFKDKMTAFLEHSKKQLASEFESLEECHRQFILTMKFYLFKPKSGTLESFPPNSFFELWLQFCVDFKDIFKKELIRLEKEKSRRASVEVSKIAKKNRADDPLKKTRPGPLLRSAVATGLCEAGGVGCANPAGGFGARVAASLPTAWPAATHLPAWKKLLKRIGGHSFGDLGKVVAVIEDIGPENVNFKAVTFLTSLTPDPLVTFQRGASLQLHLGQVNTPKDIKEFNTRYATCEATKKQFEDIVEEINLRQLEIDDDYEPNYQELNVIDELYCHIQAVAKRLPPQETPANSAAQASEVEGTPRLPKIDLVNFDGDILKFSLFYETFKSLIHENAKLNNVSKMHYLVSSLSGGAMSLANGLLPTANNYPILWNALIEKYDDKRTLAITYLYQILDFKPIQGENLNSLNFFMEKIDSSVQALLKLQLQDLSDFIITTISLSKLDSETQKLFERSLVSGSIPSYKKLSDFIKEQTKILARTNERVAFAIQQNLCFNCLNPNHMITVCTSPWRCRHHSLLHSNNVPSNAEQTVSNIVTDGGEGTSRGDFPFTISSLYDTEVKYCLQVLVIDKISDQLPTCMVDPHVYQQFRNLVLADNTFYKPGALDGMIGAELVPHIIGSTKFIGPDLPVAIDSTLGFIIMGKARTDEMPKQAQTYCCLTSSLSLEKLVQKFWEVEEVTGFPTLSPEDIECETLYTSSVKRETNGRYVVSLPFKEYPPVMGNSYNLSLRRFYTLERKFRSSPSYQKDYIAAMNDYIQQGHIVLKPKCDPSSEGYYIPHHGVSKVSSSTPLRIVFDAGMKTDRNVSLNDVLFTGEKLQGDLFIMLINFRLFRYAFTSDCKQMYRQIKLCPEHQSYQRLLWRTSTEEPIQTYELSTVAFGVKASPWLAIRTLHQLAQDESDRFPNTSKIMLRDTYMDDFVSSIDSLDSAKILYHELVELFMAGGFQLVKWATNSEELLHQIPETIQSYWKRWHLEYLSGLQSRQKWNTPSFPIKAGLLVIICKDNVPPLQWPVGIIEEVFPGKDGTVRVVRVRTRDGVYNRPATKKFLFVCVRFGNIVKAVTFLTSLTPDPLVTFQRGASLQLHLGQVNTPKDIKEFNTRYATCEATKKQFEDIVEEINLRQLEIDDDYEPNYQELNVIDELYCHIQAVAKRLPPQENSCQLRSASFGGGRTPRLPKIDLVNFDERVAFAIQQNLCFNCLNPNHMITVCTSPWRCRHHSLLHSNNVPSNAEQTVSNIVTDGGEELVEVTFHSLYLRYMTLRLNIDLQVLVIDKISDQLPTCMVDPHVYQQFRNLVLADNTFYKPGALDGMIGAELVPHIIGSTKFIGPDLPVAIDSTLGFIIMGKARTDEMPKQAQTYCCLTSSLSLEKLVQKFWEVEEVTGFPTLSPEDIECETLYTSSVKRETNGRYVVSLPFKEYPPVMGNSYNLSLRRFYTLERKFRSSPSYQKDYIAAMNDYIQQGHIVLKPKCDPSSEGYYIPHHGVSKVSSSTPLRIVFDAGMKTDRNVSLNDVLFTGEKLQGDLFIMLINFRLFRYAFTSDCKQMYRQIKLCPEHQSYQRLLWRTSTEEPIQTYELSTVAFGVKASPWLAIRTLHQLAQDESDRFPNTSKIMLRDTYMDDFVSSIDSLDSAKILYHELVELFMAGGFSIVQSYWKRWHLEYLSGLQSRQKWNTPSFPIKAGLLVIICKDNVPPLQWPVGIIEEVFPRKDSTVRVVRLELAMESIIDPRPRQVNTPKDIKEFNTRYATCEATKRQFEDIVEEGALDGMIGAKLVPYIIGSTKFIGPDLPVAIDSTLGFIIMGKARTDEMPKQAQTYCCLTSSLSLEKLVQKFWEVEERETNGRYVVSLPFKEYPPVMDLLHRIKRTDYIAAMNDYNQQGHIVLRPKCDPSSEGYYIPHHGVSKRLLWRTSTEEPIQTYELSTVAFGVKASPWLAIRTLHQLAQDESDRFPDTSKIMLRDTYMDDFVSSIDSLDSAKILYHELVELFMAGVFNW